jgi:hypothetical protein
MRLQIVESARREQGARSEAHVARRRVRVGCIPEQRLQTQELKGEKKEREDE